MAESLPALRVQLQEWTDEQRRAEIELGEISRRYSRGQWTFVAGIVIGALGGFIGSSALLLLSTPMVLIAIVMVLSSRSKRRSTESNLTNINSHIRGLRYKIADLESE